MLVAVAAPGRTFADSPSDAALRRRVIRDAEKRLGRKLTEAERRIDVLGIARALDHGKARLREEIEREKRQVIREHVAGRYTPGLRMTASMVVALNDLYRAGVREALAELRAAGIDPRRSYAADVPSLDTAKGILQTRLGGISARATREAGEVALRYDVAEIGQTSMTRYIDRLVPGALDAASRLVSVAYSAGREDIFSLNSQLVGAWQQSAVMDAGTCGPCDEADGTVYDSWEECPPMPYPPCDGDTRCRCTLIPAGASEQAVATGETVPEPGGFPDWPLLLAPDPEAMLAIVEEQYGGTLGFAKVEELRLSDWLRPSGAETADQAKSAIMRGLSARVELDERWTKAFAQEQLRTKYLADAEVGEVVRFTNVSQDVRALVIEKTEQEIVYRIERDETGAFGVGTVNRLDLLSRGAEVQVEETYERSIAGLKVGDKFAFENDPGAWEVLKVDERELIAKSPHTGRELPLSRTRLEDPLVRLVGDEAQKIVFPLERAYGETMTEQRVSTLISRWATTSADEHRWALAMQRAVAEEFGLPIPEFIAGGRQEWNAAEEIYAEWGDALRAFARAQYELTQEELAAEGIDELVLYRGMGGLNVSEILGRDANAWGDRVAIELQPASSFSAAYDTAYNFSGSHESGIIAVRVPRERILGSARTGFGCLSEEEFVVMAAREGQEDLVSGWFAKGGEYLGSRPGDLETFWERGREASLGESIVEQKGLWGMPIEFGWLADEEGVLVADGVTGERFVTVGNGMVAPLRADGTLGPSITTNPKTVMRVEFKIGEATELRFIDHDQFVRLVDPKKATGPNPVWRVEVQDDGTFILHRVKGGKDTDPLVLEIGKNPQNKVFPIPSPDWQP